MYLLHFKINEFRKLNEEIVYQPYLSCYEIKGEELVQYT